MYCARWGDMPWAVASATINVKGMNMPPRRNISIVYDVECGYVDEAHSRRRRPKESIRQRPVLSGAGRTPRILFCVFEA
jgi:hypothetical protein